MGYRVALGDVCSFYRGASVPRTRMYDKGAYLYIHYGDLYKGFDLHIDVEDPAKPIPYILNNEKIKDSQRLRDQDIVYVLTSETVDDLGHAYLFNNPKEKPTISGTETTIVRVNRRDLVVPAYLNYLMSSPRFIRELRQYTRGMKVFRVHPKDVARIEIDLPQTEVQHQIVSILDAIYAKQQANSKLNGYLEELLLAKYDKLFPVNADFTGILSDVGTVIGGATPSKKRSEYYCSNGIGWITPRDLSNTSDKFIAHGADDITDEGYASCSAKLLPKGSVLFSSRAPIGYIAIATDAVATNQGFKSIVPKEEIGTAFVYCFLVRNKQRIADMGAGTTFPEVSGKMMKSVELAVPKQTLCAEFNFFAGPILKQQEALERENRELAAIRDALLPKLMSGEIDVSQVDLTQLNSHLA